MSVPSPGLRRVVIARSSPHACGGSTHAGSAGWHMSGSNIRKRRCGPPEEALEEVERLLDRLEGTGGVIDCGWFLAVGMRACADLAEQAGARRDDDAGRAALARADNLASWVKQEKRCAVHRPPVRGQHPGRARHLGRRASPRDGRERPGRVECRRGAVGGPGLPASGRIRPLAAGRGPAWLR